MKRIRKSYISRILVLITAVMLMMLLCGCRTRITNNTEVGQMITDESGVLQETYQTRRDELGIPVAEAPLFKGTGSDEEDLEYEEYEEYDDGSEEDYEEYEEEDLDEDETATPSTTTHPRTTTTPARRSSPTVIRHPSTTQTTTIKVTFNSNGKGATCSRSSTIVKKGSTYGSLPTPVRTGYDFQGWYTDKSKGSKVTATTKVTKDKDHTLYAHWKETVKKSYKITFDGNGEDDEVELSSTEKTVKEGGTYGELPSAKRKKYTFKGWYTDAEKGSQVTSSSKFTANKDMTLYAHWEQDAYKWWNDEFKKAANEIDEESQLYCLIDEADDDAEKFADACRVQLAETETDSAYVIKFIRQFSQEKAEQEADTLYTQYSETNPDITVIIVNNAALYGGKEEKLFCKMAVLNKIYGSGNNIYEAEYDLLDGKSMNDYIYPPE